MEWFKLAANYADDPKIVAAGEQAELLFVRALAYCAREETAGHVSKNLVKRLASSNANRRANMLVKVGLWVEVEDGYQIKRWADWQSELDALAARRQADRERKRAQREREAAAKEDEKSRDVSRDSPADMSRDKTRMSHDVTPGEGRSKNQPHQDDPRQPDATVPGQRAGGGDDSSGANRTDITHAAEAVALMAALEPARLRPGRRTAEALAADVAQLLALGWPAAELQARMTENPPDPIRSLGGFLRSRLPEPTRYTQPATAEASPAPMPAWCGKCEEPSRLIDTGHGFQRCPDCSPLAHAGKDPR